MLKLLIEKELRDTIGSAKFALTFGVCSVLILLAFYTGARNHQVAVAQYDAAKAENLRQMEGLTDWMMLRQHRIFLPPKPLAALVTGISNDVGRAIPVEGRGELNSENSRFNEEPVFAVFRFLDLDFIFQIVLSLFAILFAYNAINGEKERGTLRLAFANSVPRAKYILGKIVGALLALGVPLLVPILLGALIVVLMGVSLTGEEWLRLGLVVLAGYLYFTVFLLLSVFVSSLMQRSSSAFLMLLVIWLFSVLIIPRSAVLLAGRAVSVPSVDEIASQKSRLSRQLWTEDREAMGNFKPPPGTQPQDMMKLFQEFMGELADNREEKMNELARRLNEDRRNRLEVQQNLAFNIARVSPTAAFAIASTQLSNTSISLKQHFIDEAGGYQKAYGDFMIEKTGMNRGGGLVFRMHTSEDGKEPEPVDPHELPQFAYSGLPLDRVLDEALPNFTILVLFILLFFAGAFAAFHRYDLR